MRILENENKLSINRDLLNDENLNHMSKYLYIVLSNLEHELTNSKGDSFFRCQEDLILDSGMQGHTIKKHRQELVKSGWIKSWISCRIDSATNRKHRVMFYQVLK